MQPMELSDLRGQQRPVVAAPDGSLDEVAICNVVGCLGKLLQQRYSALVPVYSATPQVSKKQVLSTT
jgi:hypothetical protein